MQKVEFSLEIPVIEDLDNLELLAYRKKVKTFLAVLRDAIPRIKSELHIVDEYLLKRIADLEREAKAKDDRENEREYGMGVH